MRTLAHVRRLAVLLLAVAPTLCSAGECTARSGTATAAVIELFTSEGCDSCPPADRWLSSRVPADVQARDLVALAYHVDYWDRLGWRDRFGSAEHTKRQHAASRVNGRTFVYTPQVLLQGRDADWRSASFDTRVAAVRATPARASLELRAAAHGDVVDVQLGGALVNASDASRTRVSLAYVDNGLVSQVTSGENRGARLVHDHVVRALVSARAVDAAGQLRLTHSFSLPRERGRHAAVVALIETTDSGEILQALSLPLAAPGCATG